MRTTIAVAIIAMAHSVIAARPALSKRLSCSEGQVPCGTYCITPEIDEHCCPDNSNYCVSNQECVAREDGDGMTCKMGKAPDLGQHGDASCLEPQMPCGSSNCFQPALTSRCCSDGTVCINKRLCVPDDVPGTFKCCDPEFEECKGAVAPSSSSSSTTHASSTSVKPTTTTTAGYGKPTVHKTVNMTSMASVGCNSTMTHDAKPTILPVHPDSCHGWTADDFKVLNDVVVLLVDILNKKGYNHGNHGCGCSKEQHHY